MTPEEAREAVVAYWLGKAGTALASARSELMGDRYDFVVNRAYYACFYAASAALLADGRRFVKHAGVRGALHRDLVNTGRLGVNFGRTYDALFDARQSADYLELYEVSRQQGEELIHEAEEFVAEIRKLLSETDQ